MNHLRFSKRAGEFKGARHEPVIVDESPRSILSFIFEWWRWLSLNILVEYFFHDKDNGKKDVETVVMVYNLVGLISALLLGMGITPFIDVGNVYEKYNSTQPDLTRLTIWSIFFVMGLSMSNLCFITASVLYLNAIDERLLHDEVRDFPIFGIPILLMIFTILASLLWVVAFIAVSLPREYSVPVAIICGFVVILSIPIMALIFFGRLRWYLPQHVQTRLKFTINPLHSDES